MQYILFLLLNLVPCASVLFSTVFLVERNKELVIRVERTTYALRMRCSTVELHQPYLSIPLKRICVNTFLYATRDTHIPLSHLVNRSFSHWSHPKGINRCEATITVLGKGPLPFRRNNSLCPNSVYKRDKSRQIPAN